jgi:hypothetical protein
MYRRVRLNEMLGVTAAWGLGGCLEQPGRQLRQRAWQSGEAEGFDETPRGADLPCRPRPEESA